MKGYTAHIKTETLNNTDYRRVLYAATQSQLVLINMEPGVEIGEETHDLDQIIHIASGHATVILDDVEHSLKEGDLVIIPAGTKHNVTDSGDINLKLYSIYAPTEHKDQTVHKTKADEKEEHFDGVTTENL